MRLATCTLGQAALPVGVVSFQRSSCFVLVKGMVNKYSCVCLHGDRRPQERKANLQVFKDGDIRFLICTDVAARGIDVQGIPFGKP